MKRSNAVKGLRQKHGVDSFEPVLDHFALSGEVDQDTKKTIWEINHIRNVIVHRRSIADRRLVEACPWLGVKIGEAIVISHKTIGCYYAAFCNYTLAITHRLGSRYGVDIAAKNRKGPRFLLRI